jgi:hypothetical protein
MGTRRGEGGVSFLETFRDNVERALEIGHLSLCRGSVRGTWRGHFFSGEFARYIKGALEMEHLSLCRGPARGTWRRVSFPGLRNMSGTLWKESVSLL